MLQKLSSYEDTALPDARQGEPTRLTIPPLHLLGYAPDASARQQDVSSRLAAIPSRCPRCNGSWRLDRERTGDEYVCFDCGNVVYALSQEDVEAEALAVVMGGRQVRHHPAVGV